MKQLKIEIIINPILESLEAKHRLLYKQPLKKSSMKFLILKELANFKNKLSLEEVLLFSDNLSRLSSDLSSKEQNLEREFIYCHLTYLFERKMVKYSSRLLPLICDAVTNENINNKLYLTLLSDEKWMMKVFEHTLMIDYSSSLVNKYKINPDRIKRVFLFLCRKIEHSLKDYEKTEIAIIKKEILKLVKSYHSTELFKRSVS